MSGFDALTHGIESFLNAQRSTPASELFALEAVRHAAASLPRVVDDGGDRSARAAMSWAATCGGLAIGLANAAVAHAMALPLGARLGVPHGLALALVQPTVLAHTWEAQPERCALLAEVVGVARPGMPLSEKARSLVTWIGEFVERIGLTGLWTGEGFDAALIATLAGDVLAYMGRPVSQYRPVFDLARIRGMYEESLTTQQRKGVRPR
jgi:alcohol dehydrogenase